MLFRSQTNAKLQQIKDKNCINGAGKDCASEQTQQDIANSLKGSYTPIHPPTPPDYTVKPFNPFNDGLQQKIADSKVAVSDSISSIKSDLRGIHTPLDHYSGDLPCITFTIPLFHFTDTECIADYMIKYYDMRYIILFTGSLVSFLILIG